MKYRTKPGVEVERQERHGSHGEWRKFQIGTATHMMGVASFEDLFEPVPEEYVFVSPDGTVRVEGTVVTVSDQRGKLVNSIDSEGIAETLCSLKSKLDETQARACELASDKCQDRAYRLQAHLQLAEAGRERLRKHLDNICQALGGHVIKFDKFPGMIEELRTELRGCCKENTEWKEVALDQSRRLEKLQALLDAELGDRPTCGLGPTNVDGCRCFRCSEVELREVKKERDKLEEQVRIEVASGDKWYVKTKAVEEERDKYRAALEEVAEANTVSLSRLLAKSALEGK